MNLYHRPEIDHRPRNICHGADEAGDERYDSKWNDIFASNRAQTRASRSGKFREWRWRIFCLSPVHVAAVQAGTAAKSLLRLISHSISTAKRLAEEKNLNQTTQRKRAGKSVTISRDLTVYHTTPKMLSVGYEPQ